MRVNRYYHDWIYMLHDRWYELREVLKLRERQGFTEQSDCVCGVIKIKMLWLEAKMRVASSTHWMRHYNRNKKERHGSAFV